jgi:hypothetical protein
MKLPFLWLGSIREIPGNGFHEGALAENQPREQSSLTGSGKYSTHQVTCSCSFTPTFLCWNWRAQRPRSLGLSVGRIRSTKTQQMKKAVLLASLGPAGFC